MPTFTQLLARTEFSPVWTAEFDCASQAISALAATDATPAVVAATTGTFGRFPATGYAEIVAPDGGSDGGGSPREIVRYSGKSDDGTQLTGVIRARFRTDALDWAAGSVIREIGLTDLFSSVPAAALPGAVPVLLDPTLGAQALDDERLTATVGSFAFRLADPDGLLAKTLAVTPVRERAVTLKLGFRELTDPAEFRVMARGRVRECTSDDGGASWKFQCRGVFGEIKDQRLFLDRRSRLTADVTAVQTTVPVRDLDRYLSTADVSPRYAKIGDEILSYTGRSAATGAGNLTGCVRGKFLSVPAVHKTDDEVRQLYEFGGHPLTVLLNLLTTTDAGGNGGYDTAAFRNGAALGIDAGWIDTAGIETVRDSLLTGLNVRFLVLDETDDAKRWIEDELLRAAGVALVETSGGRLGVKFLGPPLPTDSPGGSRLDEHRRASAGEKMELGLARIRNVIELKYSRDPVTGEFLERYLYLDADSVSRHGEAKKLTVELSGAHGNYSPLGDQGGDDLAARLAMRLGLHLSKPRPRLRVDCPFGEIARTVGDVVELAHPRLPPGQPDEMLPLPQAAKPKDARLVEIVSQAFSDDSGAVTLELRESPFALLRYAFVNSDSAPDYPDASSAQRSLAYLAADGMPPGPDTPALPFADGSSPYAIYPA